MAETGLGQKEIHDMEVPIIISFSFTLRYYIRECSVLLAIFKVEKLYNGVLIKKKSTDILNLTPDLVKTNANLVCKIKSKYQSQIACPAEVNR